MPSIKNALLKRAAVGAGLLVFAGTELPGAADDTDRKIRLMAEALHTQELGDFEGAQKIVDTLLQITPNDPQLQRLSASLRQRLKDRPVAKQATREFEASAGSKDISSHPSNAGATDPITSVTAPSNRQSSAPVIAPVAAPFVGTTQNAPDDVEGLLVWEKGRQSSLISRARELLTHARKLALEERFEDTLNALKESSSILPENPLTRPLLDEIDALRSDVEHRQRVSGFARGAAVPHLSVQFVSMNLDASTGAVDERSTSVAARVLEMPAAMFSDLVSAWKVLVSGDGTDYGVLFQLDRRGKQPSYRRGPFPLVTERQIQLYWLLRECAAKVDNAQRVRVDTSWLGMSGQFDPEQLTKALAALEDCYLLASPSIDIRPGYQARLNFTGGAPGLYPLAANPSGGFELALFPQRRGDSIDLTLNSSVTQYEGRVLHGEGSSPVYTRHESASKITLNNGSSVLMGGLFYSTGRLPVYRGSAWDRIPWLGQVHREKRNADNQKEILVIVTAR